MKNKTLAVLFIFFNFTFCALLYAGEYNVAVSKLPTTDTYVKFLNAIGRETDNTFNIQIVPFSETRYLIKNKKVDFGMPIIAIKDEKKQSDLPYDYSTSKINTLCFVLYTNKKKLVNVEELKKGNPSDFKIETDQSHVNLFTFLCTGSVSIESSLKKVDAGRIDGFLFAQPSTDKVLKQLGLKTIKRQFFEKFDNVFCLQKGAKGGELDKLLTNGISQLKANGKYDVVVGDYNKIAEIYNDWQP